MPKLVIVESPAKAKTISGFLGKDYIVTSSKGHVCDLPKFRTGIKIQGSSVTPTYEVTQDHKQVAAELVKLAKQCNKEVYLATDEDREGEAISWHLCNLLGIDPAITPRIAFHEITKKAITDAIGHPRTLNIDMVDAQQARRCLDRLVGYGLSPLLKLEIGGTVSAGRVQSAGLYILVEREREIQKFIPVTYFNIPAIFDPNIEAKMVSYKKEKLKDLPFLDKAIAEQAYQDSKVEPYKVVNIEEKQTSSKPQPPFTTSSLQQAASNRLGMSPGLTMAIAQRLYEGIDTGKETKGLITYMRTDSVNLAEEAVAAARAYVESNLGKQYIPDQAVVYTSKSKNAQEAHEAIRPTDISITPEVAKRFMEKDQHRLYTLIWKRFIACQMTKSVANIQNVFLNNGTCEYKITGRQVEFDGYTRIYDYNDKEDVVLPKVKVGDTWKLVSTTLEEKQTEPPNRYTEAGLVKKLEELGIGRPSTYASIISLLKTRHYVDMEGKSMKPTEVGFKIIEGIEKAYPAIIDLNFTAKLEDQLDDIASGKLHWEKVITDFYYPFQEVVDIEKTKVREENKKKIITTDRICPKCGKHKLIIRDGRFGKFLGCGGYPKCRFLENMEDTKVPVHKEAKPTGVHCPACKDGELVQRLSKRGPFYGCNKFPKCRYSSRKLDPLDPIRENKFSNKGFNKFKKKG